MNSLLKTSILGITTLAGCASLLAQGTAFTYQGRLNDGANPASGNYDLRFTIYDSANSPGTIIAGPLTNAATAVSNGLFTVTLDFGAGVFTGAGRWLEIGVRSSGSGDFATLTPRQLLTATPYAITAGIVTGVVPSGSVAGTYSSAVTFNNSANSYTGRFTGNGAGLTNVSAATLGGLDNSNFWRTTGNTGTTAGTHFLGTTDNQPLEIRVNGMRVLRLENNGDSSDTGTTADGAPNVICGSLINQVTAGVVGATIGGGGATNYGGAIYTNRVSADFATVSGGAANHIASNAFFATISGGLGNSILSNASRATISGGDGNVIESNDQMFAANYSVIAGGFGNVIQRQNGGTTIGGGLSNTIKTNAIYATISGGRDNVVGTTASASSIGGGSDNSIGTDAAYAAIGGGRDNAIGEVAYNSVIGGGEGNVIERLATWSLISGGLNNRVFTSYSSIGGGFGNRIEQFSLGGAIGGGQANLINTNGSYGTIPGGLFNVVAGSYGLAAGYRAKAQHSGSFVWADATDFDFPSDATNQFSARATGGVRFVSAVSPINGTPATGVNLAPGSGSWTSMSDRNAKENLRVTDVRAVLANVVALPVQTWNYRAQDASIRHIGPMAQDFKVAFGLGESDTGITNVDADGVALAAIQGLNQKFEEREALLRSENAELKQRLDKLEQLMNRLAVAKGGE